MNAADERVVRWGQVTRHNLTLTLTLTLVRWGQVTRHNFSHRASANQEFPCKDMKNRRAGHAAVELQGVLYAAGGSARLSSSACHPFCSPL